jgi:hypothetical protein
LQKWARSSGYLLQGNAFMHTVSSNAFSGDLLTPTIFHEDWWLNIATEGRYRVVEVAESGRVVGRLPYFLRGKFGLSSIILPPLTHSLGPAIIKSYANSFRRIDLTKELLGKLPPTSAQLFKCHRDVQDVIAFQSAGFRTSVQFNYEIHPQLIDVLWKNLRDKTRNLIRRAGKCHTVSVGNDPAKFIRFYLQSIELRGKNNALNIDICTRLIQACLKDDRGRIYEARDQSGTLAAVVFCAWDNVSSHYLMTARNPTAHVGATSLLVWEAITHAAMRGLIFDFDGISNYGAARFAYNFTSNVVPRYIAVRESIPIHLYRSVRYLFKKPNFFC